MSFDTCINSISSGQIEIVDMHFGTGPDSMNVSDLDPYILDEHLSEIEICSKVSRSVFFLVSVPCPTSNFQHFSQKEWSVCV